MSTSVNSLETTERRESEREARKELLEVQQRLHPEVVSLGAECTACPLGLAVQGSKGHLQ
jgi:hypothetical protein